MTLFETVRAAHAARSTIVVVGGERLRVRIYGRRGAPPIVLVPGLGMSSLYLMPTAVQLADRFEVWSPELPGSGGSDRPERALDIPELADALAGFLATVGLGPVPLLANSLGCQVLVDLAARHPERVACLVLVGPTFDPRKRSPADQAGRLLLDGLRENPSLVPVAMFDYLRTGVRRFWQTFEYALADPVHEKLPEVRQPVLVVRGGRDPIVSQRWAEEVVRLLPRGELAVIPRAPHGANYSSARELARVVRPFVLEHGSVLSP